MENELLIKWEREVKENNLLSELCIDLIKELGNLGGDTRDFIVKFNNTKNGNKQETIGSDTTD